MPPAGSASISSYFARAMPAIESKNSRCTGRDVGDHALIRVRDVGQGGDLSGVRHPHFDDGEVVLRLQGEQTEGQSEMIVEVAFGAMNAVFAAKAGARSLLWWWSCPSNQ